MWETASTQSDSAVKVSDDVVMDDENTVYDEEELKKAEEFKDKGNEYFKGNLANSWHKLNHSQPIWKVNRYVHWVYPAQDPSH